MGTLTFKEKIIEFIGWIGWKLFCWSYEGGEKKYFEDIYANFSLAILEYKYDEENKS